MIKLYGKYKLKDGRIGYAVDILGNGEACIFEVDKKGFDDKIITVIQDEIEEAISEQHFQRRKAVAEKKTKK